MAAKTQGWAFLLAGAMLAACAASAQQSDFRLMAPEPPPKPLAQSCDAPGLPREKAIATPRLKRLLSKGTDVRIAAFGSSSTLGVGATSQGNAYPLQLQDMLRRALKHSRVNVDNMGVAGELAAETAVRLLAELSGEPPAYVIWQTGVNDGMHDIPVTRFETVLRSTIDTARRAGVEMTLVGQQYTTRLADNPHYNAIGRSMERVAREKGIAYVDRFAAMRAIVAARGKEDMLFEDNFHLNDFGYRCMAEQIGKSIVEGLKAGSS